MSKFWFIILSVMILGGCSRSLTMGQIQSAKPNKLAEVTASPLSSPTPIPVKPPIRNPDTIDPELTAEGVAVYDVSSQQFMYTKHPDMRLMPASTTKMMTMLISMESYDPNEVITITREADAIGSSVDVKPGDEIRVADVIKAMMMNSGNDTAVSLAGHYLTGYDGFVNAMNTKAMALGMKNTHFSNVSGVESDDHYSSAKDLSILANEVMKFDVARTIVATKNATISTIDGKHTYKLENLNELLWKVPGVIGLKTGWTPVAGECLVTYVHRDHDVITVVLHSNDRFADSTKLINWIYDSFTW